MQRSGLAAWLVFGFFGVAYVADSFCQEARVFTVEGRLHYAPGKNAKDHGLARDREVAFTVCVSNCLWSIETFPSDQPDVSFKQVYDGEVTSSAAHFSDAIAKGSSLGNDSTLGIEDADTPDIILPDAPQIWLAYASACKFAGASNGLANIVWVTAPPLRHFKTKAVWITDTHSHFLPVQVDYFFDEKAYKMAQSSGRKTETANTITSADTNNEPLWASYKVLGFTNFNDLHLPTLFEFTTYSRALSGKPAYQYTGELLSVRRGISEKALAHGFGRKTLVEDHRFSSFSEPVNSIQYVVTDATMLPTNNPKLLGLYLSGSGLRGTNIGRHDSPGFAAATDASPQTLHEELKVGDPAPKLQIGKWVQGEPVSDFESNRVYLLDFWATWCGPCRASIPHLNQLAEAFKDKGLIVIGQDVWDKDDDVAPFMKRFGGLMTYRVALDDKTRGAEGFMADHWWKRGVNHHGIPTAFIIRNKRIVWIGHPMKLDEALLRSFLPADSANSGWRQ